MSDSSKTTKRTSKSNATSEAGNLPGIENEVQVEDNVPPNKPPVDVAVAATPEPPDPLRAVDPFDPAALRINPNTAAGAIGVKRKIVTLKVGKPDKMEFCRVHPSETYRIDTAIVEDKNNRESYLVAPALWPELPDFITLVRLCVAVNRHGATFLWPAKLPDPNGRPMDWHTSMLEAQELATKSWVRVQADMSSGSYAVFEATGNLPEPEWPELSMGELLKLAFKTRFIDSMNHPFLLELFGAA
ncbi:hypothetical protein FHS27_003321 [Rhodopirellula rubra]|uniref:Uncharacterized protein n=1 Tax=Aporhodopirellula rubra TaxID=980271 RepID=A0A7W5DZN7_9BACT|nr:hypothetical protein [Aporhodopirellula rubra]MBB3207496.1 hypothetical protein [Aporhodopirellula rubra]